MPPLSPDPKEGEEPDEESPPDERHQLAERVYVWRGRRQGTRTRLTISAV